MDPACGTCGILLSYYSKVKEKALRDKIKLDNDVSKYINGFEIVDDTLKLGQMNVLLKSNVYNTNLKNIDFLENGCLDYVDEKFDGHIIMNPPFALKKKYYFDNEELNKIFKVKSESGVMLFILSAISIVKNGNQIIAVSSNGKEIYNKTKKISDVRKYILDNSNMYKIAINPTNSFKPYTSAETLTLMIKTGTQTKEIEFVKLEKIKDKIIEKKICKVSYKELEEKQFTWNYKEYLVNKNIEYNDIKYIKLNVFCEFYSNGKRKSKEGKENGKYPLYYCSILGNLYLDEYDIEEESIMINSTNGSGKCEIYYCNKQYSICENVIRFKSINDEILTNYIYYCCKKYKNNIEKYFNGINQKKIDKNDLGFLEIPIPSLKIQNLIVEELNIMEEDIKSLNICIKNRKITLKAKLNILLKKINCKENKKLNKICEFYSNSKRKSKEGKTTGKYPLYYCSILGNLYLDEYDIDEESIMVNSTNGSGKCEIYYCDGKFSFCENVIRFKSNNNLTKYIFYWCKLNKNKIEYLFVGVNQRQLTKEDLGNIIIPIPSIEEQEKIVKELDIINNDIESMKNSIKYLEQTIKDNFNYHLDMCEKVNNKNIEDDVKKDCNRIFIKENNKNIEDDVKKDCNRIFIKENNKNIEDDVKKDCNRIFIKEKQYIKEGDNVYKIKNNKKEKLYGIYEGNKLIKQK